MLLGDGLPSSKYPLKKHTKKKPLNDRDLAGKSCQSLERKERANKVPQGG